VFTRKLTPKEIKVVEKVIDFVKDKHAKEEGHDYSHVLEVTRFAIEVGTKIKQPADPFVVLCSALLHDMGRINAPDGRFHGIDGASRAEEFLESLIEDHYIIDLITRAIVRHSPQSMIPPETTEEKILFDADALDRLGVMGMIRGIMGKHGSVRYIVEDRITKRMADYDKLNFKESKIIGKDLHKQTIWLVKTLKKYLAKRAEEIHEISSYKAILHEENWGMFQKGRKKPRK
jgi:HD superfamily phosphodiesterase